VGVLVVEAVLVADGLGPAVVEDGEAAVVEAVGDVAVPAAEPPVPDPFWHATTPRSATARVEAPRRRVGRLRRGGRGRRVGLVAGIRSNLSRHPGCHPNP
jgi:hypothetical protein